MCGQYALLVDELGEGDASIDEPALATSVVDVTFKKHEANISKPLDMLGVVWWFIHCSIRFPSIIMSRYSSVSMTQKLSKTGGHSSIL